MYSRESLAQQIASAAATYKRRSLPLVVFSVAGGLGQLWLHTLIEKRYERPTSQNIELAMFLVYIVIVIAQIVWLTRSDATAPKCPSCGAKLKDMSGRLALATGRCDRCGAQVIE
jgi:predicted RNA-binding Zn-ribbon protein involved in translation (DUF1610 family)